MNENDLKKESKKIPVLWQRLSNGIAIRDLQEGMFDAAIKFLKEHYIPYDDFLADIEISSNFESIDEFLKRMLYHFENNSSLIATHEVSEEIAGIIILHTKSKLDFARTFSRPSVFSDEICKRYAIIKTELIRKIDLYQHCDCQTFLEFYSLCVAPNYRQKGLGLDLMLSAIDVARSKNIPVFLGCVTNYKILNLFQKLGLQILYEVDYTDYTDDDGKYLLKNLTHNNNTMSLMFTTVPPFPKKSLPKKEEPTTKGKGKNKKK